MVRFGSMLFLLLDEVNAIVIDVGSGSTRVGYAGEDTPKAVYPSVSASCKKFMMGCVVF